MNDADKKAILDYLKAFKSAKKSFIEAGLDINLELDKKVIKNSDQIVQSFSDQIAKATDPGEKQKLDNALKKLETASKTLTPDQFNSAVTHLEYLSREEAPSFQNPIKQELKQILNLVSTIEPRIEEMAALKPGRIPQLEAEQLKLKPLREKLEKVLNGDFNLEAIENLNLETVDPTVIQELVKDRAAFEESISKTILATKISKLAYKNFFEGRTNRFEHEVRSIASSMKSNIESFSASGEGLTSSFIGMFQNVYKLAEAIAVQSEQRRLTKGEDSVDNKSLTRVAGKLKGSVEKIGESVQLAMDSVSRFMHSFTSLGTIFLGMFEFFITSVAEARKANKELLNLFGAQQLNYSVDPNSTELVDRLSALAKKFQSFDEQFGVTYKDRMAIASGFLEAGGSIKSLGLRSADKDLLFTGDVLIRDLDSVFDLSGKYEYLLGLGMGELGGIVGNLTSTFKLTTTQIDEIFAQAALSGSTGRIRASDVLNGVIELSTEFGGVVNTFFVNQRLLTKIARITKLSAKQSTAIIKSMLQAIQGFNLDSINALLTLSGRSVSDANSMVALRNDLLDKLRQIKKALVEQQKKSPPELKDEIGGQIQAIELEINTLNASTPLEVPLQLLRLTQRMPQSLIPLLFEATSGGLSLLFGEQRKVSTDTALEYESSLRTFGQHFTALKLPQEVIDMLVLYKFGSGTSRQPMPQFEDVYKPYLTSLEQREALTRDAKDAAGKTKSQSEQIQQFVASLRVKINTSLGKAFAIARNFTVFAGKLVSLGGELVGEIAADFDVKSTSWHSRFGEKTPETIQRLYGRGASLNTDKFVFEGTFGREFLDDSTLKVAEKVIKNPEWQRVKQSAIEAGLDPAILLTMIIEENPSFDKHDSKDSIIGYFQLSVTEDASGKVNWEGWDHVKDKEFQNVLPHDIKNLLASSNAAERETGRRRIALDARLSSLLVALHTSRVIQNIKAASRGRFALSDAEIASYAMSHHNIQVMGTLGRLPSGSGGLDVARAVNQEQIHQHYDVFKTAATQGWVGGDAFTPDTFAGGITYTENVKGRFAALKWYSTGALKDALERGVPGGVLVDAGPAPMPLSSIPMINPRSLASSFKGGRTSIDLPDPSPAFISPTPESRMRHVPKATLTMVTPFTASFRLEKPEVAQTGEKQVPSHAFVVKSVYQTVQLENTDSLVVLWKKITEKRY